MCIQQKCRMPFWVSCILAATCAVGQSRNNGPLQTFEVIRLDIVTVTIRKQHQTVRPGETSTLAIDFRPETDWHFYAAEDSAPGGKNLKLTCSGPDFIQFAEPIFPASRPYFDKTLNKQLPVFSGNFTVYLPFTAGPPEPGVGRSLTVPVTIAIDGALCSHDLCRMPDFGRLTTDIQIAADADMTRPAFALPRQTGTSTEIPPPRQTQWAAYSTAIALPLALLAGLLLNIMPCVWPVLPIIIMKLIDQAKHGKARSIAMGLTFCLGILLFFAALAAANIVLQLFYHSYLQWGDQFRNPTFVAGMALLLVVLALFMFGTFSFAIPSSIAGKAGTGKGYAGLVAMGFLAALLSTPCSFAILAAAFAWAQAQPLPLATAAIMVIGLGMAIPYAVLTAMPGLLKHLPRAGRWTELSKQAVGFLLLLIAVKLVLALPLVRIKGLLYFATVLAFCVWMAGSWVSYSTRPGRKWLVRTIAAVLAVLAGCYLLSPSAGEKIDWKPYDTISIEKATADGRPVLIKFTAAWCLSCQAVDKLVYARDDIARLIRQKSVLAIKADTTEKDFPATAALKTIYNEPGVPVSILSVPDRKEPARWRGFLFADKLKLQLQKLPDR